METTQRNDELEIDLLQLFNVIRSHFLGILVCGVMFALVALVCTKLFITPQYVSTAKMYVLNRSQESSNSLTNSDLQSSAYLTKDYIELCKTRTVTENVISRLGLDLTHEELLKKMTVSETNETRVISISVEDPDPYVASQIAEAITDIASDHIQNITEVQAVHTADNANVPEKPVSPNTKRNTLIGGIIGLLVAGAAVVITFLVNDTLRTSEEVERYLDLHVLGSIPLTQSERDAKKKKKKHRSSKNRKRSR